MEYSCNILLYFSISQPLSITYNLTLINVLIESRTSARRCSFTVPHWVLSLHDITLFIPFFAFPLLSFRAYTASLPIGWSLLSVRNVGAKESRGRAPNIVCGIPSRSFHPIILSVGRSIDFVKSGQGGGRWWEGSKELSHSKDIR